MCGLVIRSRSGWQSSASHTAVRVKNRIPRARLFFSTETG
ncbi:hypothetical protein HEB94_001126 [Actinopolymorpha pittospori]|uniref:Uncharacterized protein n=1 Tax=Actinopolymorpha pittospori TaxID=648752 RepID=A0A927RI76_9ACTN|nr:hypothetical protein [Actinopolymorpha pittospori]